MLLGTFSSCCMCSPWAAVMHSLAVIPEMYLSTFFLRISHECSRQQMGLELPMALSSRLTHRITARSFSLALPGRFCGTVSRFITRVQLRQLNKQVETHVC